MNSRWNLINNLLLLAFTVIAVFVVTLIGNNNFYVDLGPIVAVFILGAILAAVVNTLVHEFGHVIAGKKNGFTFISMRIFLFTFVKLGKKLKVEFTGLREELGETEMLPNSDENLEKRFIKMTKGGLIATTVLLVLSLVPLVTVSFMGAKLWWVYALTSMFFPVSVYFFFANVLPMENEGLLNDGAVISGLKNGDAVSKVTVGLLKIHSELMRGKSPAEIDESLFYDLPQLPEDNPNFTLLLNNRYAYELDKGDFEKVKKLSDRLEGLLDDMPKAYAGAVMADLLYNACTFDFDEEKADNLVEDNERYLNGVNNFTNLRIKSAYLTYVVKDYALANEFISKAEREVDKCRVEGLKKYEQKLISKIKRDLPKNEQVDA